jgi:hypothetical protein
MARQTSGHACILREFTDRASEAVSVSMRSKICASRNQHRFDDATAAGDGFAVGSGQGSAERLGHSVVSAFVSPDDPARVASLRV